MINEEYSPAAKQAFDKVKQGMLGNVSKLFDKYKNPDAIIYGRARKELKKVQDMENTNKLKEAIRKALVKEIDPEVGVERYEAEQNLSQANNLIEDTKTLLSRLKNKALLLYQRGKNYYIHDKYPQYSGDYNPYRMEQGIELANEEMQKLVNAIIENIIEIKNISGYEKNADDLFNQLKHIFETKQRGWREDKYYSYSDDPSSYKQGVIQDYYKKMLDMFVNKLNSMGSITEKKAKRDYDRDGEIESPEKEYKDSRDKAIKKAIQKEDLDLGHEDDEPHMIKAELYKIGKYAMELYQMVDQFEGPGEVDFPAWWQSKITNAASMISSAKHYLEFELKEPEVDAAMDALTGEEYYEDEPMMEGEIGKDEMLASRLYKIKNNVQPAFYLKVRRMINNGELKKAEEFIKRMEPVATIAQSEDVIDENKINALEEIKAKVLEKLTAKTPMKTYIKDFAKSDAPQFKGKTKEKKRQMAVAAKLSKEK